jgi:peptidoglycan/LPS O-acetylase OafA/YrhL
MAVIFVFYTAAEKVLGERAGLQTVGGRIVFGIVALCATILAALASWNLIEKRALALKDRIVFRRRPVAEKDNPFYARN